MGALPPFQDPAPDGAAGDDARRLRRLQGWRNRPDTFGLVSDALKDSLKELSDRRRTLRGADGAWAQVAPPSLRDRTTLVSLERGTLVVAPADSAVGFELDRWLRSGGLTALGQASGGTVRRVRSGPRPIADDPRRARRKSR